MKICPICNSANWDIFFHSPYNIALTSDQRIVSKRLSKDICVSCGVLTNSMPFSKDEIIQAYTNDYELNIKGCEEHIYFTEKGAISRSQAYCDWVEQYIPFNATKIIEIGCGEGLFLEKLSRKRPALEFKGYDGSIKAVKLAKRRGFDVEQKLILRETEAFVKADAIILNGVVEHVEELSSLFKFLKSSLNNDGSIIFTLPIVDELSYDMFFYDHVWHFTKKHFFNLVKNNGMEVVNFNDSHPIIHGFGLFVCKSIQKEIPPILKSVSSIDNTKITSCTTWLDKFNTFNQKLNRDVYRDYVVFGSGEIFSLLMAYTDLPKCRMLACVDETKDKQGSIKHGIPVYGMEWLTDNYFDAVVIATNPKYYKLVRKKLDNLRVPLIGL